MKFSGYKLERLPLGAAALGGGGDCFASGSGFSSGGGTLQTRDANVMTRTTMLVGRSEKKR